MTQPLDAEAVRRDDELLDALAFGELEAGYDDDETAQLLLGWRDDIVQSPVIAPRLLPASPAVRRGYLRLSKRMTVAAAVVGAVAAGSIGSVAAASVAEPGSPLWPITKVVYTDRAESLEARDSALSSLKKAKQAAAKRNPAEAKHLLAEALKQVTLVREGDDRDQLENEVAEIKQALAAIGSPAEDPAPATDPSASASPSPADSPAPDPAQPTPSDPAPVPSTEPSQPVTEPSPVESVPPPQTEPSSPPAGDPQVGLSSVPASVSP
jgi:hypothetical protein